MGYYTRYEISRQNEDAELDMALAAKDIDLEHLIGSYTEGYENPFDDRCKWYEHETDMCKVSKDFPKTLFLLEGEGEESGDIWREYHKNGKSMRIKARIVFDPFNETNLS